jgi:hypothetical protein
MCGNDAGRSPFSVAWTKSQWEQELPFLPVREAVPKLRDFLQLPTVPGSQCREPVFPGSAVYKQLAPKASLRRLSSFDS